ncbi:MAG TPA: response regulator [Verrucomicrobiae bacterium]|jgi:DNA-binding NtrC family response regulator|nr:response regulator [Verrucomicrobiae bacterium]
MTKILIVDDEKEICSRLKHYFTAAGYQVFTAGRTAEALGVIRAESPEVVLLDVPEKGSSLELLQHAGSETQVILVAADADNEKVRRALISGAAGCVAKPYTMDDLEDAVRRQTGCIAA